MAGSRLKLVLQKTGQRGSAKASRGLGQKLTSRRDLSKRPGSQRQYGCCHVIHSLVIVSSRFNRTLARLVQAARAAGSSPLESPVPCATRAGAAVVSRA